MIPFLLSASNSSGKCLELTRQTPNYICEYTGLNPMPAIIATQSIYRMDGSRFNGARADVRNVVLNIFILKDARLVREQLYEIFKIGDYINFAFENLNGKKYFNGYVESFEFNQFDAPTGAVKQSIQISILCPDPWLYGEEISVPMVYGETAYTKGLEVLGDTQTGLQIEIALGAGDDSAMVRTSNDRETEAKSCSFFMDSDMTENGGTLFYDSEHKIVTYTHGSDVTDVLPFWVHGSEWARLQPGHNDVMFYGTSMETTATLSYTPKYQGV